MCFTVDNRKYLPYVFFDEFWTDPLVCVQGLKGQFHFDSSIALASAQIYFDERSENDSADIDDVQGIVCRIILGMYHDLTGTLLSCQFSYKLLILDPWSIIAQPEVDQNNLYFL